MLLLLTVTLTFDPADSLSEDAAALWDRLTGSADRSVVPPIYEDVIGSPDRDLGRDLDLDFAPEAAEAAFRFPKLDAKQRKFAVNPAFKSFYDPSYRQVEGVSEDKLGELGTTNEVSFFCEMQFILSASFRSAAFLTLVKNS